VARAFARLAIELPIVTEIPHQIMVNGLYSSVNQFPITETSSSWSQVSPVAHSPVKNTRLVLAPELALIVTCV